MLDKQRSLPPSADQRGVGLIELMVGLAVGTIAVIVMMQVFAFSEGQRRLITSGADAQINGQLAMFSMERDLRIAGYGLTGTDCTLMKGYNENADPKTVTYSALPVVVSYDSTTQSDQIEVRYSLSAFGSIASILQEDVATSDPDTTLQVNYGKGYKDKDMVLISQPGKFCTLMQLSTNGVIPSPGVANTTQDGLQWALTHAHDATNYPFNPPAGTNIFPTGGYTAGAKVRTLGSMVNKRYYVQGGNLMMLDLNQVPGTNNPVQIASGIVAMRAQYGRDTTGDGNLDSFVSTTPASEKEMVAIRLALVARGTQYDKDYSGPTSLTLWNSGPSVTFGGDDRKYRYRVYLTTIPMRNTIWNNNP